MKVFVFKEERRRPSILLVPWWGDMLRLHKVRRFINPQQVLGFPIIRSFRGQNNWLLLDISNVFVLLIQFLFGGIVGPY